MRRFAWAIAMTLAFAILPASGGSAAPSDGPSATKSDIRELGHEIGRDVTVTNQDRRDARALRALAPPVVGEQRVWLAYDDAEGVLYPKLFTLRGVGTNVEVWVASDEDGISSGTEFPAGDCRNDGIRNVITDEQVQYLIDEFDTTMYPIESAAFSVPPMLDGSNAPLTEILGLPRGYYRGPGDRVVTLVDNVRDENFYDTNNASQFTYVAGFYTSTFDFYFNRLTMTIDAFDWLHRTGATPPNEPSGDPCTNANARPYLYEGVFAHEYQHLLMNYEDVDEGNWINEGLSDWAQTITSYVDPSDDVNTIGFDSHVQCFLGWGGVETPANPLPREGGPENSLTLWGDQTDYEAEILCDYGAAYTMMEYLAGRFGQDFMTALHADDLNGLASLQSLLDAEGGGLTWQDILTRWAAMVAIDASLDDGWSLIGGTAAEYQTPTLNADINWDTPEAYAGPGVPANGSDYVQLRDGAGDPLTVGEVDEVVFDGVSDLPSLPLEWRIAKNPPDGANRALYSGKGDNIDRSMVRPVRVRAPKLHASLAWDTELGYDYAYVQVSDDGGATYRSVRCTDSVAAPLGWGFEGTTDGFVDQTCNLRRYEGERVLLAFRYVTDASVMLRGFWVDDVSIGHREISNGKDLAEWSSPTQILPVQVERWVVQLVAFDEVGQDVHLAELTLDANWDGTLSGAAVDTALGTSGSTVAAIVTYLDGTEMVLQTAPYTLTVNGVMQPGGAAA